MVISSCAVLCPWSRVLVKKGLNLVAGAWSTEAPSALRTQICPFVGGSEQENMTVILG